MRIRILVSCMCISASAGLGAAGCGGGSDSSTTAAATTSATTSTTADPSAGTPIAGLGATVTLATAGKEGAVVQSVQVPTTRLRPADVITEIEGKPIDSLDDIEAVVSKQKLLDSFEITVYRGSRHFNLDVVTSPTVYLGAEVRDPEGGEKGVTVVSVAPGGPAEDAGLQKGDLILALDGSAVPTGDDLIAAVARHQVGDEVVVTVSRDGKKQDLEATIAPRPADAQ